MKKRLLSLAIIALIISACSKDNNPIVGNNETSDERVAIKFISGISTIKTKVTSDSKWESTDAVGVFMASSSSLFTSVSNEKYTPSNSGVNKTEFTGETYYYPIGGEDVDFRAYCPYKTDGELLSETYKIDITSQTKQSDLDLLYATKSANKNLPNVELKFSHQLSKIVVKVEDGTGLNLDLTNLKVTINGIPTKADFDLADGKIKNSGSNGSITLVGNSPVQEAIIIPNNEVNRTFVFELQDGTKLLFKLEDTKPFEGGYKYVYNAKIGQTKVEISGTIEDWIEEEINIEPK